ncbi:MAG: Saccharopine dehydrogenase [Candidatus Hydrogenedentes bacterium ADurb.Bin101]|nr:MAG: Saccharopine dehydrogenase [Candidatus Hydrogenedentes bacterium ADurb.Bin101]
MNTDATILVLGAYGLAGRAIVSRLVQKTPYIVLAAGRDRNRLKTVCGALESPRIHTQVLDALAPDDLAAACRQADFIINAVGPFARNGAAIARTVLEVGKPYLDCANEQQHYHRLKKLEAIAVRHNVPLITAAGAIPGLSTLLVAQFPDSSRIECCWAQLRHAYPDSGLASMMGGILEALAEPATLISGRFSPVVLGKSSKTVDLPPPFGRRHCLELPTIDALTLPGRMSFQDYHTWFYLGELPLWLLDVVRVVQPQRCDWVYRAILALMRRINMRDTENAIATGIGPEALLLVTALRGDRLESRAMMFVDGAAATACLPVYLAHQYLTGRIEQTGPLTPLDLVDPELLEEITSDIRMDFPFNGSSSLM